MNDGPPPDHDRPFPGEETVHNPEITKADPEDVSSSETSIVALDSQTVAISAFDRAAIDSQIATAKQYPRKITAVMREARTLACLDADTAQSMIYAVKRAGKLLEGPSVRLAEVMAHCWGNLRADTAVIGEDKTMLTAAATCFDLEKNVAIRSTVKRRITKANGQRYNDDMIMTAGNAAASIALRNAVFKVIPRALVNNVYQAARKAAIGEAATLTVQRQKMVEWFGKVGVKPEQIFQLLEIKGLDDIGEDQIITLRGLSNAIRDGEQKVEHLFGSDVEPSQATTNLNEAIRAKAAGTAARPAAPAPEKCPICFRTDGTHDINASCGKEAAAKAAAAEDERIRREDAELAREESAKNAKGGKK